MFGWLTKVPAVEAAEAVETFTVTAYCYGGQVRTGFVTAVNEKDAFDAAFAEPAKWFGTGQVENVTVATAA